MFTNENTAAMDKAVRTWPFVRLVAPPVVTMVGITVVVGSGKDKQNTTIMTWHKITQQGRS